MIFFTSDTHYRHTNILKYCPNRQETIGCGERDIDTHDKWLVDAWNCVVRPKDLVFHIGDFALGSIPESYDILERLNGRIILIAGNHDWRHLKDEKFRSYFEHIHIGYFELRLEKVHFTLCHYPMQSWNAMRRGGYCLHGHIHQNKPELKLKNLINVGVDQHEYLAPFNYSDIITKRN